MLSKLFDWYRIADPTPSDETVQKRRAAVVDLVGLLRAAERYDLLIAFTSVTVVGLKPDSQPDSEVVAALLSAVRNHQPAFPGDLFENALALRACAALAVGEVLQQAYRSDAIDKDAIVAAGLLTAATGIRPRSNERYLARMLDELASLARAVLQKTAIARRQRSSGGYKQLASIPAPNPVAPEIAQFWTSLQTTLESCFQSLEHQSSVDREELEVLWWLYSGSPSCIDRLLHELPPGAVALCCGAEIADRVLAPPLNNTRLIVRRATGTGRGDADSKPFALSAVVQHWEPALMALLCDEAPEGRKVCKEHPDLQPLSWLCRRLRESKVHEGWEPEFQRTTGIDPAIELPLYRWAEQAFDERVAQRIIQYGKED